MPAPRTDSGTKDAATKATGVAALVAQDGVDTAAAGAAGSGAEPRDQD